MNIEISELSCAEWNTHGKGGDEMSGLVESIREQGQINPVLVRPLKDGGYEIVDGHRRVEALRRLGMEKAWAVEIEMADDAAMAATVTANLQREENDPILEAELFKRMSDGGMGTAEIAAKVGKGESYVVRRMRLVALTELWRKAAKERMFTVDCLEHISEFEPSVQDSVHESCWEDTVECLDDGEVVDWGKFKRTFETRMMPLDGKRFSCEECASCPYNTATHGFLFSELDGEARCQMKSCYAEKCEKALTDEIERLRKKGVKVAEVSDRWKVPNYWSITDRKNKDNRQPYVWTENGIRVMGWGLPKKAPERVAKTKEEREAEKAARAEEKRRKACVEAAVEKIAAKFKGDGADEIIREISQLENFRAFYAERLADELRYYVSPGLARNILEMAGGAEGLADAAGVELTDDEADALSKVK